MAAVVSLLSGCTRNDGNIGKQFGQWQLRRLTVAGVTDTDTKAVYWSFQSSTIEMKRMGLSHEAEEQTFGNYTLEGDELTVTFPDRERKPLSGLYLSDPITTLKVVKLTSSELVLRLRGEAGAETDVVYYFKKF